MFETEPHNSYAYFHKATIAMSAFDFKETVRMCDKAIKLKPDNFDVLMLKARALFELGNDDYKVWIEKARNVDRKRTEAFMKDYWLDQRILDVLRAKGREPRAS